MGWDDNPQDYIGFWTSDGASPLASITLAQLLSFTSGLEEQALCQNVGIANFANCVETIYDDNLVSPVTPGSEFHYGSSHLQVAGLMAVLATGAADWTEVFDGFKTVTSLFPSGVFDLPSATNPRLAGGMHWTAEEYVDFLARVYDRDLFAAATNQEYFADRTAGLVVSASPAADIGLDYHYGAGYWLECESDSSCAIDRISSPGA